MRLAIATVCLSGGLGREARGHRRCRLQGRRDLRERSPVVQRHARRRAPHGGRPRHADHHLPAVPRLRGHARRQAHPRLRPRGAQVRPDAGAGLRPAAGLLQRLAGQRSAASTAPRPTLPSSASAPASAACASASRRWPGDATSTTTATPGRRCAAPTTRPSASCSTASIPGAQDRPEGHPLHPARPHLPGAGRGRARARHGPAVLEPALPQLSGPGRPCRARFHGGAAGHGVRWPAVAGDLQRPVPGRLRAQRGHRWPPLPPLPHGRAAHPHRRHVQIAAGVADPLEMLRHRVHRVLGRRGQRAPLRSSAAQPGLRQSRRAQVERR